MSERIHVGNVRKRMVSRISVSTGNGFGSGNTKIRRYSTIDERVGTDVTFVQSATDGDVFRIETDGQYLVTVVDGSSATSYQIGISVNTSEGATDIAGIDNTRRLAFASRVNGGGALSHESVSVLRRFKKRDVIFPHMGDNAAGFDAGSTRTEFVIERLADDA